MIRQTHASTGRLTTDEPNLQGMPHAFRFRRAKQYTLGSMHEGRPKPEPNPKPKPTPNPVPVPNPKPCHEQIQTLTLTLLTLTLTLLTLTRAYGRDRAARLRPRHPAARTEPLGPARLPAGEG